MRFLNHYIPHSVSETALSKKALLAGLGGLEELTQGKKWNRHIHWGRTLQ